MRRRGCLCPQVKERQRGTKEGLRWLCCGKAVEVRRSVSSFTSGKRVSVSERRKLKSPVGWKGEGLVVYPPLSPSSLDFPRKSPNRERIEEGEGGDAQKSDKLLLANIQKKKSQTLHGSKQSSSQTSGLRLRRAFVCLLKSLSVSLFMDKPPPSRRKISMKAVVYNHINTMCVSLMAQQKQCFTD